MIRSDRHHPETPVTSEEFQVLASVLRIGDGRIGELENWYRRHSVRPWYDSGGVDPFVLKDGWPTYHLSICVMLFVCTVAGGSPYGVTFGGAGAGAGGVYAPPPYEQLQHHQAIPALSQQLPMYSPAAAMYAAAAGYPGYIGYPVQYYPYYPTAVQPSIQPLRPTIMIPNGFEAGGRFEGLAQTLLPPAPPGVPPSPAHLAAIQPHQVLWR